jgi:hypothetical protein
MMAMFGLQDILAGAIVVAAAAFLVRAVRRSFAHRGCSGCPSSGQQTANFVPLQLDMNKRP